MMDPPEPYIDKWSYDSLVHLQHVNLQSEK